MVLSSHVCVFDILIIMKPFHNSRSEQESVFDSKITHQDIPQDNRSLRKWSAEDLSRTYTNLRPRLVNLSRGYVGDYMRAEEVVQDAFLYLMTALPEVDSEEGVLKFLQWKVRLLSLDVLKVTSRYVEYEPEEPQAHDAPQPSSELERQEDAAVIRLALAQLSPKHREALIANVYQEKSFRELAEQFEVSENAARQLVHRARASFRKKLVGEVDARGMNISQILSVATKKALRESGNIVKATLSSLLVIGVAVGGIGLVTYLDNTHDATQVLLPEAGRPIDSGAAEEEDKLSELYETNSPPPDIGTLVDLGEETPSQESSIQILVNASKPSDEGVSARVENVNETDAFYSEKGSEALENPVGFQGPLSAKEMNVHYSFEKVVERITVCSFENLCLSVAFDEVGRLDPELTFMTYESNPGELSSSALTAIETMNQSSSGHNYELRFSDFFDERTGRLVDRDGDGSELIDISVKHMNKDELTPQVRIRFAST